MAVKLTKLTQNNFKSSPAYRISIEFTSMDSGTSMNILSM